MPAMQDMLLPLEHDQPPGGKNVMQEDVRLEAISEAHEADVLALRVSLLKILKLSKKY